MIGLLPKTLNVNGVKREIRSDFRVVLNIFVAFNDPDLTDKEKCEICVRSLYKELYNIPAEDMQEAVNKAYWFVGGGDSSQTNTTEDIKVLDWEQDESIIFPAINKVAGTEIRSLDYFHWWSFLGLFNEIGEGLLSTVLSIREKKAHGKKLEKHEKEFYKKHKAMIDIREKLSAEDMAAEQADEEFLNILTGGETHG